MEVENAGYDNFDAGCHCGRRGANFEMDDMERIAGWRGKALGRARLRILSESISRAGKCREDRKMRN
jgi:hypothetical protein